MPKVRLIDNIAVKEQLRAIEQNSKLTDAQKFRAAKFVVENAPTVEAEPVKQGQWINNTFCSECKRFPVDVSVSISNQELTKYFSRCPHCGTRMR